MTYEWRENMKTAKKILAVVLICLCLVSFSSCLRYTSNLLEVTRPVQYQQGADANYNPSYATVPSNPVPSGTAYYSIPSEFDTQQQIPSQTSEIPSVTQAPVTQAQNPSQPVTQAPTQQAGEKDPSQWTKSEIITNLSNAVNSAKAYTGNLTVNHTEEFANFNITECPGGAVGINLANSVASALMKPTSETLNFSGGRATNSDGDSVPILLPKRNGFSLSASGVQSARAYKKDGLTVIEIKLVQESCSLNEVPKHNAGSIGYLDLGEVDLSIVKITKFNVNYTGSTLVATLDAQGRVLNVVYAIPVEIVAAGSAGMIKGEIKCSGAEKETWQLNW